MADLDIHGPSIRVGDELLVMNCLCFVMFGTRVQVLSRIGTGGELGEENWEIFFLHGRDGRRWPCWNP